MPVSMGLLNVRTDSFVSAILLYPGETIFVSQMMTHAMLVLRLDADAQGVAVGSQASGLLKCLAHANVAGGPIHLISIHDAMVDLVADFIEGTGIDTVARKIPQRFGVVENLTRTIEVRFNSGCADS
jgi:hypothetical protein